MNLIEIIMIHFANNLLIGVFLGTFFFGEPFFLAASFFLADNLKNIGILFLGGVLASSLYDLFLYHLPDMTFFHKIKIPKYLIKKYKLVNKRIKYLEKKETFLIILFSKFLLGIRSVTLFCLGANKIKKRKFLLYSLVTSVIWVSVIIALGLLANKGLIVLGKLHSTIKVIAGLILFVLILVILIKRFAYNYFLKIIKGDKNADN